MTSQSIEDTTKKLKRIDEIMVAMRGHAVVSLLDYREAQEVREALQKRKERLQNGQTTS